MQYEAPIHMLWDDSHIWGLMIMRALHALGLPFRLSKGREIAEGLLLGKSCPSLIIVPGGNARLKAAALGKTGLEEVRNFVKRGGSYLGICGGAGLALSSTDKHASLGLCPWSRKPYPDRLQHLSSGHVLARISPHPLVPEELRDTEIPLPVWWPGRFSAEENPHVSVLATARERGQDFWLGDVPLSAIPPDFFEIWNTEYGLDLSSQFLKDMPLVVCGSYGKGRYVLSYSHLETPDSKSANAFFAHLIGQLTSLVPRTTQIPIWDLSREAKALPDDFAPLAEALSITRQLAALGISHHLFFQRTPWLLGWKSGLPGAALNSLNAALSTLQNLPPSERAARYWSQLKETFQARLTLFSAAARESLLTGRIASVLGPLLPHTVKHRDLNDRKEMVFGNPRDGGGLLGELLLIIEEMIYLSL